jgi:hypothetical protein
MFGGLLHGKSARAYIQWMGYSHLFWWPSLLLLDARRTKRRGYLAHVSHLCSFFSFFFEFSHDLFFDSFAYLLLLVLLLFTLCLVCFITDNNNWGDLTFLLLLLYDRSLIIIIIIIIIIFLTFYPCEWSSWIIDGFSARHHQGIIGVTVVTRGKFPLHFGHHLA